MLRISEIQPPNHGVTLRLEGRVAGPWVAELLKACEDVLAAGRVLKLDLGEVEFLDASGVALLSSLRSRGVPLIACSMFVETQLKASPDPAE
jgi:ABC-type transporter Mla MlaB component